MPQARLRQLADRLPGLEPPNRDAVVGFDGFVDEMLGVVGGRDPDGTARIVATISDFGESIVDAAGKSFGREIIVKSVEPGGNAPNLAAGLSRLGLDVDFYGTLGSPMDPVFVPFARRCRSCTTIGDGCGRTLAFEFDDGKLMFNETSRLASVDERVIRGLCETGGLAEACERAGVIGLANWSRYPHMTGCWRALQAGVPGPTPHDRWVLIDLADPSTRPIEHIREMVDAARGFRRSSRVILGVNRQEASFLIGALGGSGSGGATTGELEADAGDLRDLVELDAVMVHGHRGAAMAIGDRSFSTPTAFTSRPVRSTGVGDRFNAGVAFGLLAGVDAEDALLLGCAAGGWFVRTGAEASRDDLASFCRRWGEGTLDC